MQYQWTVATLQTKVNDRHDDKLQRADTRVPPVHRERVLILQVSLTPLFWLTHNKKRLLNWSTLTVNRLSSLFVDAN